MPVELQKQIIVENIKKFLKQHDMTQSELANKIDIAKSTMSDYMNYRSKPGAGVLEKMAAVFGVTKADIDTTYKNTMAEIIDGELTLVAKDAAPPPFSPSKVKAPLVRKPNPYISNLRRDKKIPILGRISAGVPIEAVEEVVDRIIPPYETSSSDELFGLVVHGESMNRIVPNGHYAILKKQPDVENGEIAAVIVNGNYATLKKVYKFTDLIVLEPCSHDPSYRDQQYSKENCDEVKIIGKFLYSVSPMFNN